MPVYFYFNGSNQPNTNTIGGYTVQADGKISIIKNSKPVALRATIEMKENGAIRIFGETHISMTDYEIEPPQAEMGSIKTEDEVKVIFDVVFVK
ncbi:MAG: YceI family protein [Cyclobacteriaceae bacterium]|nr:YceI family protein [Cyclobacteriaceae bacterium]